MTGAAVVSCSRWERRAADNGGDGQRGGAVALCDRHECVVLGPQEERDCRWEEVGQGAHDETAGAEDTVR